MAGTFTTHIPDLSPVPPAEPQTVLTSVASSSTAAWNTVLDLSGESGWVYMLTSNNVFMRVTVDGGTAREIDPDHFDATRNISSINPDITADYGHRVPMRIRFESSLLAELQNSTEDTTEMGVVYSLDI